MKQLSHKNSGQGDFGAIYFNKLTYKQVLLLKIRGLATSSETDEPTAVFVKFGSAYLGTLVSQPIALSNDKFFHFEMKLNEISVY